jgi:uncharacterized protein YndB with AHSA1/START domain
MTQAAIIAPVHKTVTVNVSQARAFEVYTANIDRWWPRSHHLGKTPMTGSSIEPRVGGRWIVTHEDGSETVPGVIKVWDPPRRLVHSWDISAAWSPDATVASEVEINFIAEGPDRTRVELEHRNFERMGPEGGRSMREAVNGDGGWTAILEQFRKEADAA